MKKNLTNFNNISYKKKRAYGYVLQWLVATLNNYCTSCTKVGAPHEVKNLKIFIIC